jgi:hypothetical protein
MREYQLTTLYVDYGHILSTDDVLADAIQRQYYRFLPYLRRAVYDLVAEYEPTYLKINPTAAATDSSNLQNRDFSVAFYHLPLVSGIRDLRADRIGTLMSISGTVTRTSEVRPELLYGSFTCEACKGVVNEVEQQFKYTEVSSSGTFHVNEYLDFNSQVYVLIPLVATALGGNSKSILPSSPIGRKLGFRKIHQKYRLDQCPDHWMLFFAENSWSVQKLGTNAYSPELSSLFPMSAN